MGSIVSLLTQPKPSTNDGTSQPRNLPAALSKELRGKLIHVDMSKSFQNWRSGARHPEYERLRRESDRVLEIGVLDSNRCNKFKKSDFALFSALWWPDAAWEDLYTVMLFTAALFVWDDTIDTNEHTLASDFERAELWRQQSLSYFKYHLQLAPQDVEPYCPDDICLVFKEFAERFCKNFGEEQRHRMFSKIEDFVEHNKLEQIERLTGRIPNYEEYMRIRYGVTGVRMFTLLLEVAQQAILPAWVMDSSEMEEIIEESNYMIIVINDILSLKKEIATDCVVNVVPVLYKSGQPLEEIIPSLTEEMHASRDRLDNTATRLDSMTRNDPQLNKNVMTFIDGIRIMVTGTLEYSIEAPRYGVRQYLNPNGSLDIVL